MPARPGTTTCAARPTPVGWSPTTSQRPARSTPWHTGLPAPRWLAYYWDRQPRALTAETVTEAPGQDLVVIRLDRQPGRLPTAAMAELRPVAQEGRYALFRVADLRAAGGLGDDDEAAGVTPPG